MDQLRACHTTLLLFVTGGRVERCLHPSHTYYTILDARKSTRNLAASNEARRLTLYPWDDPQYRNQHSGLDSTNTIHGARFANEPLSQRHSIRSPDLRRRHLWLGTLLGIAFPFAVVRRSATRRFSRQNRAWGGDLRHSTARAGWPTDQRSSFSLFPSNSQNQTGRDTVFFQSVVPIQTSGS